ncbi:hypoxanthine phosphoribosyltransferase [Clostridium sp. CAG:798]|jgi:hypoxanthine phosphoribosyltransferase|nr:hypoxanthine phosphoribosyltransferase [Clostridium sp. CAG:798]HBJ12650.1 hypoxanthine phosphoribosyltransferase [Clostridiales bacterium]
MEKIKVLISKEQIENRVKELAKQIRKDYKEKTITAICLLKGSLFFTADLTREIGGKIYLEFMQLSSYEGENTTGTIKLKKDIDFSEIKGKDVLIIEDIVDTGITLNYTLEHIKKAGANSVKVCTLLNKPSRRKIKVPIDYVGFEIENKFVLGYGMDYDQLYRNLPYIGYIE